MRKTLVAVVMVGALGTGVAGCNSAWWQNFQNDPVEGVQTFEAAVEVAVNAAQLAWPAILQAISAANQAQASTQFTNALSSVNHALQELNDDVNAAAAAQTNPVNFTALMQAVSDAVSQVIAIVDTYTAQPAAAPIADAGAPPSVAKVTATSAAMMQNVADLHTAYKSLGRWGVKIQTH